MAQHGAQFSDHLGGIVLPPRGGARVQKHCVALIQRFGESRAKQLLFIRYDGIGDGLGVPLPHHGGEDGGVELHDVSRLRVGGGRNDLVPGGDDANPGTAQDLRLQHPGRQHGADGGRRDPGMRRQDHLSGTDVLADLAYMLPGGRRSVEPYRAVVLIDHIFDHHHRVAVGRDGIARVYHREISGPERDGSGLRGAEGEPGLQSDAVHGARQVMGSADVRVYRSRGDPSAGVGNGHTLRFRSEAVGRKRFQKTGFCLLQRKVRQIFKCHCLLPLSLPYITGPARYPRRERLHSPGQCRRIRRSLPAR